VGQVAELVVQATGGKAHIEHLPDPRVEAERHYYRAAHTKLLDLGLVPHLLSEELIESLVAVAVRHRSRILPEALQPTVDWRSTRSRLENELSITMGRGQSLARPTMFG
jgi:UDP-sulfoquinovose synthase